ncbi:pilus assembly PilX N-terminal domain-containing protein [Cerasicoccus frondis]|uniref:pilus assembly PilX N-terminal domain-containing protein n=1 Tax=Cerasicoccus frondis TaxID=490090 RepID=UPI002852A93F|nr:pilus assembly PilX N-terminal domain-containing protein [Cerasicoccus frondis]
MRKRFKKAPSPKGFALVISLILMALMVLLMTSLATLTSVELSSATQSKQDVETREVARFAILEAMGELQQFMGPDARISARHEIYDADPDTLALDNVSNPWLTAIWDASAPDQLPRTLISGNDQSAFDPASATSYPGNYTGPTSSALPSPNADDDIALIYEDSANPSNDLYAPKEDIVNADGVTTGRFAWVILDEGIKTNLHSQTHASIPAELSPLPNQSFTAPETTGLQLLDGMADFDEGSTERSLIERSIDMSVLDSLSSGGHSLASENFHHATFKSTGVLSKTTYSSDTNLWGGLKVDLTNALSADGLDPSLIGEHIFPAATSNPGDDGGPLWDQLHAWVNLSPSNGNTGSGAAYAPIPYDGDSPGVTPVLTLVQLHVNVLVLEEATPNQYAIWYFLQPAFVLWNPYDAAIDASSFIVDSQLSNSGATELKWLHRVEWHPQASSSEPVIQFPTSGVTEDGNQYQYIGLQTPAYGRIAFRLNLSSNLQPGEAVVFSPQLADQVITSAASPLDLYPGYRSGFSFAFKVPNSTMTIDPAEHSLAVIQTISQQRVSGVVRLARTESELATQPLQHIERLNISGFNSSKYWDRLYATGSQLDIYGEPGTSNAPFIEDIGANFSYRAGQKFAHSRLEEHEATSTSGAEYFRIQWLEDYNPTAPYVGRSPLEYEASSSSNGGTGDNPSWIADFFFTTELASAIDDAEIPNNGDNAFVGFTDDASDSLSAPLFHLPRTSREFYSIGDLRHARLGLAQGYTQAQNYWKWGNTSPAYAIGSSSASPYLEADSVYRAGWPDFSSPDSGAPVYYDMPWNLNTALWDDYFFSTIVDSDLRSSSYLAENPRIYGKTDLVDANLDSATDAAGELYVHGAFNVNSTSVEAWKALLAANFGAEVETTSGTESNPEQTPYLRHPYPRSEAVTADSNTLPEDAESYTGFRTLSEAEIDTLANAIVKQVKLRGPFVSMAEFVNRAPTPTSHISRTITDPDSWRQTGALQAAIDESGINAYYFDLNDASDGDDDSLEYSVEDPENLYLDNIMASRYFREFNRDAMQGAFAANAPGYLTQGDLLAAFGSQLTVRSDTFRIRVWAESLNPLGMRNNEMWAEAVVQRTPNKLDPNETITDGDPLNGQGRRFVITSFRWLNSPDSH